MNTQILSGYERFSVVVSHVVDEYIAVKESNCEQIRVFMRESQRSHARVCVVVSLRKFGVLNGPAANKTCHFIVVLEATVACGHDIHVLVIPGDAAHVALSTQHTIVRPEFL